jgi:Tol biopolymer transport system component
VRLHAKTAAILASSVLSFTTAAGAARPADPTLLSVSDGGKLTIVNVRTGRVQHFLQAYQAAWSPDGKRIAFAERGQRGPGDLFLIDADGHNLRRLTHSDDTEEHDPVWSSDGKRLAYFAQRVALSEDDLMVLNLSTGVSASILRGRPLKGRLQWSPDGRKFAFVTSGVSPHAGARVIDATTGQPLDSWLGQNYPVWSADGSSVAYVVTENEQTRLLAAKQDGSRARVLYRGEKDVGVGGLTWSPNGRTVAFHHGGWSVNWSQILAVDTATGRVRSLTEARGHADTFPAFSQDGKRIAFGRMKLGQQPRVPHVALVLSRGGAVHVYRNARMSSESIPLWRPRAH